MMKKTHIHPCVLAVLTLSFQATSLFAQSTPPPPAPPAPAAAATPPATPPTSGILPVVDYSGGLMDRSRLTGDWGGTRTDLANKGVMFDLDLTQTTQKVVSGGLSRDMAYGGSFDFAATLDLDRMGVMRGGLVRFRAESRYGDSVNDVTGSLLPSNTDALMPLTGDPKDDILTVTELNYTQFLSPQIALTLGKYQTLDGDPNEFASGRGRSQFMNFNFIANSITAITVPYSTLGGGIILLPTDKITITSLLTGTADSSTTTGFDKMNQGLTWSTEADFQYKLGKLPGGFNVGGIYAFAGDFTQVNGKLEFENGARPTLGSKSDSWGFYVSGWQYVYTPDTAPDKIDLSNGRPDLRGFGLFSRIGFADDDTNPIDWSASIGIGGRGMIPGRDNDTFGVGYVYSQLTDPDHRISALLEGSTESVEGFYNFAITPAVGLTFDVQWNSSAFPEIAQSTVLGFRLDVRF